MYFIKFFKHIYFPLLVLKIMLFIIVGSYLGLFSTLNNYIYQLSYPYLPYPTKEHKSYVLVDASQSSFEKITEIIQEIETYNPLLIIADISHKEPISMKKSIQYMIEKKEDILFTLPYFKEKEFSTQIDIDKINLRLYHFSNLYQHRNINLFDKEEKKKQINYNGNPIFSKVHLNDFLENNILPEFFNHKIVIISNFDNNYAMVSKVQNINKEFTHQSYLALMFISELNNIWLKSFSEIEYFIFILIITITWIYFSYHFFYSYKKYIFSLTIFLPFSLYWIILAYYNFLLPVSEMFFISFLLTLLLSKHWEELRNSDETQLIDNLTMRLQDKVVYKTFFNTNDYWDDITLLINQLFNLRKNILLEKVAGDTRVKEVSSYNCEFTDIKEMRRDYEREPYLSALKYKKIIKLTRKFFQNIDEKEEEFIVPLLHHNEVIGFWVFSLNTSEIKKIKNFELLINNCAKEVSQLLFDRSEFLALKNRSNINIDKLLNVEIKSENTYHLKRNLSMIEKRMLLTETILDTIHSHIIVYNLFGKIMQINQPMSNLLQEEKIASYTMSAGDMLSTLAYITTQKSKEIIREVVFTQNSHSQLVTLKNDKKKYLLTVSAITQEKISKKFTVDYIFDTYGILFELHDFSYVENIYRYKQNIMDQALIQNEKRVKLLDKIIVTDINQKNIIHNIIFSANKLQTLMNQNIGNKEDDLFPINFLEILKLAYNSMKNNYPKMNITFDIEAKDSMPLVLLSANYIQIHLENLIAILIEDNEEEAKISIILVEDTPYSVAITLKSNGYGMPQKQLTNYLSTQTVTKKYILAQEAQESIIQAMGTVFFYTNLGEGITIKLSFKSVHL